MRIIKQAARGCTDLPHVGPHPGTGILLFFITIGCAIGIQRGWIQAAVCGGAMLVLFGSMYLVGAYQRAEHSDQLEAQETQKP